MVKLDRESNSLVEFLDLWGAQLLLDPSGGNLVTDLERPGRRCWNTLSLAHPFLQFAQPIAQSIAELDPGPVSWTQVADTDLAPGEWATD